MYAKERTIKLSRIENKIERIKTLHFTKGQRCGKAEGSLQQQSRIAVRKQGGRHENSIPGQNCISGQGMLQKTNSRLGHRPLLRKELDSLFTLEEPKEYTLKKRTLQALSYESQAREEHIQVYQ